MDLGIRGKQAIVNGGSAGLGRGSALALAREGVNVVISARGEERLRDTCSDIARETGATVTAGDGGPQHHRGPGEDSCRMSAARTFW